MKKIFEYVLNNKTKFLTLFIILFIIFILTLVFIDKGLKQADMLGKSNYITEKNVAITIPKGAYLNQIAKILYENNIISYPNNFISFAKANGGKKYKFGVFYLNTDMSYKELDIKLQENAFPEGTIKITIPEGYELRQIIQLLEDKGLGTVFNYSKSILNDTFNYDFLDGIEKSYVYLEGYLFPATYYFTKGTSEYDVLNTMLKKFENIFTIEMKNKAKEKNMTIEQTIILASIVEREAGNDSERNIVASVFYNRLNSKNYPYLESCATVQYILKERKAILSIADTQIESPYNTYINPGLPPHPIASPGLKSIEATLNPAETDYLFFVLGKDGKHIFSKTYAEHLDAKNR